jgi:hypothetical protein
MEVVPYCQGLNCQKISGGVDICLFIVIFITHRRFSIINNGGGVETDPLGYPRAVASLPMGHWGTCPPSSLQKKNLGLVLKKSA